MGKEICEFWNPVFIANLVAVSVLLLASLYLSIRRVKRSTRGVTDWGVPWSGGQFIFNATFWYLGPRVVFYVLFREALPALFEGAADAACDPMKNFPYLSLIFVLYGLQLVFLYHPDGLSSSTAFEFCDDEDLLAGEGEGQLNDLQAIDAQGRTVLVVGTSARGRLLVGRSEARTAWKQQTTGTKDSERPKYVAKTIIAIYPCSTSDISAEYIQNNLESKQCDPETYSIIHANHNHHSHRDVYQLPLENATVDKVLFSPFFRNLPPIGSFTSAEFTKAKHMSLLLDEALRVLKPGGKIVWVDAGEVGVFGYADLRDKLGEEHIKLVDEKKKIIISYLTSKKMIVLKATKPDNYGTDTWKPPEHEESSRLEEMGGKAKKLLSGEQHELMELMNEGWEEGEEGEGEKNVQKRPLSEGRIHAVVCPLQAVLFLGLSFGLVALYRPLSVPVNIPAEHRISAILLEIVGAYPTFAFFEREYILQLGIFTSVPQLLKYFSFTTVLSLVGAILASLLLGLPKMLFHIPAISLHITPTAATILGWIVSILVGFISYVLGTRKKKSKVLTERHLSSDFLLYMK